jgi:hypothetical protein
MVWTRAAGEHIASRGLADAATEVKTLEIIQ